MKSERDAQVVIAECLNEGFSLSADNAKLSFKGKHKALPGTLRQKLESHKDAIIQILQVHNVAQISQLQQHYLHREVDRGISDADLITTILHVEGDVVESPEFHQRVTKAVRSVEGLHVHVSACREYGGYLEVPRNILWRLPIISHQSSAAARAAAEQTAHRGLSVHDSQLFRIELHLVSGQKRGYLLLAMHHMISDAWSADMLLQRIQGELAAQTTSEISRIGHGCGETRVESARQYLDALRLKDDIVPAHFNRVVQKATGPLRSRHIVIDREVIGALSVRIGVSHFAVALSASSELLNMYHGGRSTVVGLPVLNRTTEASKEQFGLFANVVPFVMPSVEPGGTFEDHCRRVNGALGIALRYQDLSVSEFLKISRERGIHELLSFNQVLVQWLPSQPSSFRYDRIETAQILCQPNETNHLMTWTFMPSETGCELVIDYRSDVFTPDFVQQLGEDFNAILGFFAREVQSPSHEALLLPSTKRGLEFERCLNKPSPDCEPLIVDQLYAHVEANPDRTALISGAEVLSYRQLINRAERLGKWLSENHVSEGDCIALYGDQSVDAVIGVVACQLVGCPYLYLDPSWPSERLQFMCNDSGVRLVVQLPSVGTLQHLGELPEVSYTTVMLESETDDRRPRIHLTDPYSYVIYTSGTTGQPKGVKIHQRQVTSLVKGCLELFEIDGPHRWSLLHSLAFDFSVWELWGALLSGGTVVLVSRAERGDPHTLANLLNQNQVSVFNGTPSVFEGLLPLLTARENESPLRRIFLGGERLNFSSLKRWFLSANGRGARVYNVYGVTETTVLATAGRVDLSACEGEGLESPIGVPIPGWNVMIRDSRGGPLPLEVVGEIVISGDGVAAGYQNRSELTSQRFYSDPISGRFCYRTGDLAYRRTDGVLCYVGRADRQVKIAGHRIELGEIEVAINAQVKVESSRVLSIEGALIGFVQTDNQQFDGQELLASLKQILPGHMLPSQVITLKALPVKWNGKVDESILVQHYQRARENSSLAHGVGSDPQLLSILECFSQSLGRQDLTPDTDFFLAGGDSIKCLALLRQLHERGFSLELRTVYEQRTPRRLFQSSHSEKRSQAMGAYQRFSRISSSDKKLIPDGIEDAFPMTRMQQSMLFHGIVDSNRATYINAAAYAVETDIVTDELLRRIDTAVDRYSALRSLFDIQTFSQPLQLVQSKVAVDIEIFNVASRRIAVDEWLLEFCDIQGSIPFDLNHAPLWRCSILADGSRVLGLGLAFHHAILDGWSVSVLVDQLLGTRGVSACKEMFPAQTFCSDNPHVPEVARQLTPSCPPRVVRNESATSLPPSASRFLHLTPQQSMKLEATAARAHTTLKALVMSFMCRAIADLLQSSTVGVGVITHTRPAIPGGDICVGNFLSSSVLELSECHQPPFEMAVSIQKWLESIEREQRGALTSPEARLIGEHSPIFLNYVDFSAYTQVGYAIKQQRIREVTDLPMIACFVKNFSEQSHSLEVQWIPALCDSSFVDQFLSRWRELIDHEAIEAVVPESDLSVVLMRDDHLLSSSTGDIAGCILSRALLHPDAIAVEAVDGTLTYGELHARVLHYGALIRSYGVACEDRIGVDYTSSCERIALVVAVLYSGCTLVPLDSRFDAERSRALVQKTDAKLVFAPRSFKVRGTAITIAMEDIRSLACSTDDISPQARVKVAETAYMIGTSGSTGAPKVAMVRSVALDHHNLWMLRRFKFSSTSKVLHRTSPLFDAALWEVLVPLYCGGVVVVGSEETLFAPDSINKMIREHEITHIQMTPTLARYWIRTLEGGLRTSVSDVFCGGEELTREIVEAIPRTLGARLHNLYGPSETTIDVLFEDTIVPSTKRDRSIGRPIPNVGVAVLDSSHRPVPIGVVGELGIFGISLGVGYFEDPTRTKAQFVESVLPGHGKQRVYLTGDKAVQESDGTFTFRGRTNRETKIRGLRVDLDELELCLRQSHPEVDPYLFVSSNGTQIDCWFKAQGDREADSVRTHLCSLLGPDLVGVVLRGKQLLQLASGKPDRAEMKCEIERCTKLLSDVSANQTASATERQVAEVWAQVLRTPIERFDRGFLESGGTSLSLLKVHSELSALFQTKLNVIDLLKKSTVRQHAHQIEVALARGSHE